MVGRDTELASVRAFVDETESGPASLVLEGEAGIGKTTLWEAGVEHARARGVRVLTSRPAEAERSLGHAGLADLLDDVVEDVLQELRKPRRQALEVALLREEVSSDPVDRRTLAVAVRDAVQRLGELGPTLIAVDDVQWLDSSSSLALAFSMRRLDGAPVRLLLARRLGESVRSRNSNERWARSAFGSWRWVRSARERSSNAARPAGRPFARQTLLRIHERSAGNPFFALEIARVLPEDVDPLAPLPVPHTVEELLGARIAALPRRRVRRWRSRPPWARPPSLCCARAGVAADALDWRSPRKWSSARAG